MNKFLTCPEDCDTELLLPAIEADPDCDSAVNYVSQIEDLVIFPEGVAVPADPSVTVDMTTAIDNTVADNSKAKHLVGIGGIAEPEESTRPRPRGREKVTKRTYTGTFRDENVTDAKYELFRKMQCGYTDCKLLYANEGHIFGPIQPKKITVKLPLSESRDDVEVAIIEFTWEADGDPPRYATPF